MATQNAIIKHIESKISNPTQEKKAIEIYSKIRSNYGIKSGAIKEEAKDIKQAEERA